MNVICTLKQATEHFHVRAEKMAQWTIYEFSETSMLIGLSYAMPICSGLAVYSAKKPILLGCYLTLGWVADKLIDQIEYQYGIIDCAMGLTGEINVNFE